MRWMLVTAGIFLFVMWFACWSASVVPGSPAVMMQWVAGNALAFLGGLAFGDDARVHLEVLLGEGLAGGRRRSDLERVWGAKRPSRLLFILILLYLLLM